MLVALDIGSFALKAVRAQSSGASGRFDDLSYLVRLDEATWESVVRRNGTPPAGYIRYNDVPYAVGSAARRHRVEVVRGEARYRDGWYDVMVGYALAHLLPSSSDGNLVLMVMHPPKDEAYADDILRLAAQKHVVQTARGTFTIRARHVMVLDEPLCGYSHVVLKQDGERYVSPIIKPKPHQRLSSTLLVDVGGNTADAVAVDQRGVNIEIDYGTLQSSVTGTIKVLMDFEIELRRAYKYEFQSAVDPLDPARLDMALRSGVYQFGVRQLDCAQIAKECLSPLASDVVALINRMGGVANYDNIVLVGGGSPLVFEYLRAALPDANLLMADNAEEVRWANALGGVKALRALAARGDF